jgi:hypothetical protein
MVVPDSANIVVLASNYNPSIVSKEWLLNKGIFVENIDNFMHTPVFSMVENEKYSLISDEQRLQIVIKKVTEENIIAAGEVVKRFVDVLPETPYKALGFNYQYNLRESSCNLAAILTPKTTKIKTIFTDNYQIGAIITFQFEKFLTTCTISPSLKKEQPNKLAFNYHSNVSNAKEIKERISSLNIALKKSETIIQELCDK